MYEVKRYSIKVATLLLSGLILASTQSISASGGYPEYKAPEITGENLELEDCFQYIYRDGYVQKVYKPENTLFVVDLESGTVNTYLILVEKATYLEPVFNKDHKFPYYYSPVKQEYHIIYDTQGKIIRKGTGTIQKSFGDKICIFGSELPNYMEEYERSYYLTRQDIHPIEEKLGEIVKKIVDFKGQEQQKGQENNPKVNVKSN